MQNSGRQRIAVLTDSTADLPRDLVQRYGIHVIPQILVMGTQTWRDGVDIDPASFYKLLKTSPQFPTTSQATVGQFEDLFRQVARQADGIVAVLLASSLSGTINSARVAAASLPDVPIEIVDTQGASLQQGFIVLAAARRAAEGGDMQAVAGAARALIGRVHIFFVVDTLEYLHRGGRIGAAARLFGTALNLKPLLCLREGLVQPVATIRTRHKALERLFALVEERLEPGGRLHMGVLHVAAPQQGEALARSLAERFRPVEMIYGECGPVIGAHVGPGTMGTAFYSEPADS